MKRKLLVACMAATFSPVVFAQVANVRVDDGTTVACLPDAATAPAYCTGPSTGTPHVNAVAIEPGVSGTELWIVPQAGSIKTIDAATGNQSLVYTLNTNIGIAAGLETQGTAGDYAGVETQTDASGQTRVLAKTEFGDGSSNSVMKIEGDMAGLGTNDTGTGNFSTVQTTLQDAFMGYGANGAFTSSITVNADGNQLLGDTSVDGAFSVTGASTLNGIDNQSAGITNAGTISGVTNGAVDASSTEAVNGSQLYTVEQAAATAQTTADTAITNAATAQATADTALANAATAQTTANDAVTAAAAAQTTADTAQATADTAITNAATAQATADTAITDAATAQTTANTAITNATTAQTTANTAITNAATAQTTANTAITNATTAQTTANTAITNAATAQTTANTAITNATTAQTTADTAITNAATAQTAADTAQTTADTALTDAATAQTTADTAVTDAAAAKATAASANTNATTALTAANSAVATANGVSNVANAAYALATGFDSRLTSLEDSVRSLEYDINRVDRMAARGIAIATALASMPDLDDGKTAGFGIGVGSYAGRNAVSAAFILRASDSVKVRINAGTAGDGKFAVGAGGMFSW